jgi:hypothetical protein
MSMAAALPDNAGITFCENRAMSTVPAGGEAAPCKRTAAQGCGNIATESARNVTVGLPACHPAHDFKAYLSARRKQAATNRPALLSTRIYDILAWPRSHGTP